MLVIWLPACSHGNLAETEQKSQLIHQSPGGTALLACNLMGLRPAQTSLRTSNLFCVKLGWSGEVPLIIGWCRACEESSGEQLWGDIRPHLVGAGS